MPDAFGNALGSSIVGQIENAGQAQPQLTAADREDMELGQAMLANERAERSRNPGLRIDPAMTGFGLGRGEVRRDAWLASEAAAREAGGADEALYGGSGKPITVPLTPSDVRPPVMSGDSPDYIIRTAEVPPERLARERWIEEQERLKRNSQYPSVTALDPIEAARAQRARDDRARSIFLMGGSGLAGLFGTVGEATNRTFGGSGIFSDENVGRTAGILGMASTAEAFGGARVGFGLRVAPNSPSWSPRIDGLSPQSAYLTIAERTTGDGNGARNRALHEVYKDGLLVAMDKPFVADKTLSRLVDQLYRPNAIIGSGSTASAVRLEMTTGQPVGGAFHTQKAEDSILALQKWLVKNPSARPGDRAAAENLIRDMNNALRGK